MKEFAFARVPRRVAFAVTLLSLLTLPFATASAQSDNEPPHHPQAAGSPPASKPDANPVAEKNPLPPLPPDAHVEQSITVNGKKITYTATVGTLFVRDSDGKAAGQLVYTA